jgi:hypothetical protein
MPKVIDKITPPSPQEKELLEAIDRVYNKYGTDLESFFRDVAKENNERLQKETLRVR